VMLFQWLVVGIVAKAVKHCPHLNTLLPLLAQKVKEQGGDGVVTEIEILQMNAALGLADGIEHVVELSLSGHQERYTVVV